MRYSATNGTPPGKALTRREGDRKLYRCDGCGRWDVWGPGWTWFSTGPPNKHSDPEPEFYACSSECRRKSPFPPGPLLDRAY